MASENERFTRRPRSVLIAVATAVAAAGLAAVYGIAGFARNEEAGVCTAAQATVARMSPLVRGEVAALILPKKSAPAPALAFNDADGGKKSLADWRGRTVLFNLWATWCAPCRTEMPALDALQAKLGGPDFEVVAVNIDTRNLDKPKAWLKEAGVTRLAYYADPAAKVFQDLKAAGKAFGMPTTLLIDKSGCELASLAGPAEWASADAVKLIEAALGR